MVRSSDEGARALQRDGHVLLHAGVSGRASSPYASTPFLLRSSAHRSSAGTPQPTSEQIMNASGTGRRRVAKHDIIVIGASAGGVEALSRVIADLPRDLRAAILIVLHISRGRSLLPEILTRAGRLAAA